MVRKVQKKPVRGRTSALPEKESALSRGKDKQKSSAKKSLKNRIRATLVPEGKRVKIIISDNTVRKFVAPPTQVVVRSNLQLALLSPFRFPMPQERVIGSVARYAGVFFVLVGGFFSLLNLEYATGNFASILGSEHVAQTSGTYTYSTGDGATATQTTSSGDTSGSGTYVPPTNQNLQIAVDPTPDVRIATDAPLPLRSTAPFNITVPYANKVKVLAERDGTTAITPLGDAFRIDNSTWRFYWMTMQFPDGEYRMRVMVENQYGSYEHRDDVRYIVDNIPDAPADEPNVEETPPAENVPDATASTTDPVAGTPGAVVVAPPTPTTTATTTATLPSVTLRVLEAAPLAGGVPLEIVASQAAEVKVYARNVGTNVLYYVGVATRATDGLWRLEWDSKKVFDGVYALRAIASFTGGTAVNSPILERTVKNGIVPTLPPPGATTTQAVATTTAVAPTPTTTTTALAPTIDLRVGKTNPVSGFVDVFIKTSPVMWVELYALPKGSLTQFFIGIAQKISSTDWKYTWSTTQSPNGDYELYARVKTEYGFTEGKRIPVRILNQVVEEFTEEQEDTIDVLRGANGELVTVTENPPEDTPDEEAEKNTEEEEYVPPKAVYVEPVKTFIERVEEESETNEGDVERIETVLTEFRKRLNVELNNLARAEREGNEDELRRVKENIENLRADVIKELTTGITRRELIDRIDGYLNQVTNDLRDLTLKNEQILKERVGEAIEKDSDRDGITDYDEVNLYLTNPFAADTDGDSYIDSIEIKLGYNPLSPKSEALVTYESPKDVGIIREDILTVDTVTTLAPTEAEESGGTDATPPKALISGKGLPNSFVTLYIFSTPIVLTVKTDSEGSWSYVFDKELDEGEHEVYVGITDNAGRIVAKSAPLPFVKTAVAFNEAEAAAPITVPAEPTLVDERMLLLVASIAIVGLGLVLILLGLHVRGRQEVPTLAQAT